MSVDCNIYLPSYVRVEDVATVIAGAMGFKVETHEGYSWARQHDVKIVCTNNPALLSLQFGPSPADPQDHSWYYFLEGDDQINPGSRCLHTRSYKEIIAVGRRLVNFFGGRIDYQDCDSRERDYVRPWKKPDEVCPTNGKPWTDFQKRLLAVKPLTAAELDKAQTHAAYR